MNPQVNGGLIQRLHPADGVAWHHPDV